ncbi:TPA: YggS family pyridoxal phosphate-dependent enzyme [Candidatus Scatousia excrementigallinarum]|uniref:Pyridoxal phosphate homeostasis protein n=1 Tax=Candidatus Scatousia excrementigallinarum TaxID=2840935 RepID=A0A9D1EYG1_9BACT|nr:YggS family pyridoxal phosphate-dependent enzyme [Candidatus Scatousia excrementigallinarum]
MFETVKMNLSRIQEEIAPYKPNIIAVTKYFGQDAIIAAYQAGLRDFGESRAVEAIEKINQLPKDVRENSRFHFIGHLQTNKARKVVENFDYIHSIDSVKLADAVSKAALESGKIQKILLQLNNANEIQKFGFSKEELITSFDVIRNMKGLHITGLMNMAPFGASDTELKDLFNDVVSTRNILEEKFNCKLPEVSMGMSQDYRIAAQCGATMLRIGRKLFS